MFRSSTLNVAVFKVVCVPLTVKLPVTTTLPVAAKSANVTLLEVATACPIDIAPLETVTPVPAEMCARTSAALGPVYVITPVLLLYANEPSPPASVTDINARVVAAVVSVKDITPVELL